MIALFGIVVVFGSVLGGIVKPGYLKKDYLDLLVMLRAVRGSWPSSRTSSDPTRAPSSRGTRVS